MGTAATVITATAETAEAMAEVMAAVGPTAVAATAEEETAGEAEISHTRMRAMEITSGSSPPAPGS